MKSGSGVRVSRLESNLMNEIQSAMVRLDIVGCSITSVMLNKDLKHAKIYCISNSEEQGSEEEMFKRDQEAASYLATVSYAISKIVVERWSGQYFPKFTFLTDKKVRYESKIHRLLDSIEISDEKND